MDQPVIQGHRHFRSFLKPRLDNFGLVLLALIVTLLLLGGLSETSYSRVANLFLVSVVFFLAAFTSGVPRRRIIVALAILPVVLAVGVLTTLYGSSAFFKGLAPLTSAALVVAATAVIVRRLARHAYITFHTVMGSLCVYMFLALLFSLSYRAEALISGQPFFVQTASPEPLDYVYFSFVTIATLGFGDFTPATNLGKMMTIVEAMGGQLYLVVVVALFIGNLGRRKKGEDA